jgi:hypothetical protein
MKKTVVTSFLWRASNEVISFSRERDENRLLRKNYFIGFLTITNYAVSIEQI